MVNKPGTRGPYAKTAARKADIVRAARDSFAERGFANASLRDIAERAGITHAGLLHHYRSKDELLAAVLAQRDTEEWRQGRAQVDRAESLGPYLIEVLLHHQKSPELMRLWLELATAASRPDHPAHLYFVNRYESSRTHVARAVRERAAEGQLREGISPEIAAVLYQAVLNGLQVQWLLDQQLDIVEPLNAFLSLIHTPDDP
ncbi:TetR/AcrR family transcriptional regulator [Streptomyces sp. NPDC048385]|uniref:TetR/AcrR family transcriptional regulator n=1 Tax=Streptomyces sp. NPDC048385 TaxID=3155145 RepID=UPI00344A2665